MDSMHDNDDSFISLGPCWFKLHILLVSTFSVRYLVEKEEYLELQKSFYTQELEARDKISARLNIPLVLLISIASFFTYVAKNIDFSVEGVPTWVTCLLVIAGLSSLFTFALATYAFISALGGIKGHLYRFIPNAETVENYRNTLREFYKDYDSEVYKNYFYDFLLCAYAEYTSKNAAVNDRRSRWLHHCSVFLTLSILPLVVFFLTFIFSGYNGEKKVKENNVVIYVSSASEISTVDTTVSEGVSSIKEHKYVK